MAGFDARYRSYYLENDIAVVELSADPTEGAGVAAEVGTIGLRDTGELWQKTGAEDTAWLRIAQVAETVTDTAVARFDANGNLEGNPSTFIFDDGKLVCSYGGTSDAITMYLKTSTNNYGIRVTEDNIARTKPMIFLTAQYARTSDVFKIYNYATAENVDSIAITQWAGGHCVHVWLGTALTNSAFRATEDNAARTAPMVDLVGGSGRVAAIIDIVNPSAAPAINITPTAAGTALRTGGGDIDVGSGGTISGARGWQLDLSGDGEEYLVSSADNTLDLVAGGVVGIRVESTGPTLSGTTIAHGRAYGGPVTLDMSGANTSVDASLGNFFTGTLSAATTQLDNPGNLVAGQFMTFAITTPDGSKDLTFDTYYDWGDEGEFDITGLSAGETAIISCIALTATGIACTAVGGFTV